MPVSINLTSMPAPMPAPAFAPVPPQFLHTFQVELPATPSPPSSPQPNPYPQLYPEDPLPVSFFFFIKRKNIYLNIKCSPHFLESLWWTYHLFL